MIKKNSKEEMIPLKSTPKVSVFLGFKKSFKYCEL